MRNAVRSAAVAAALATIACAPAREPTPPSRDPAATTGTLLTFTATVDVDAGTVTIVRDAAPGASAGALTTIPVVQDGVAGSGPADTVELVTTAVRWPLENGCGPGVYAMEVDVALTSFFNRTRLRNAHVELMSMTPSGRESCNSSPAFDGHSDLNGGFWDYGDLEPHGMEPPPSTATRTWRLKLPSPLNFTFRGRVVADPVQAAVIDYASGYWIPTCTGNGPACDTGALVDGRGNSVGGEVRPWSNLWGCIDGETGTYHVDESLDRLSIRTVDGSVLAPEKLVRVEATVWATDPLVDALDLFVNADPTGPDGYFSWVPVVTLVPSAPGGQTLFAEFTLPYGGLRQAIRGVFRRGGVSTLMCSQAEFDDTDDLLFAVDNAGVFETVPPTVSLYSPMGTYLTGTVQIQIEGTDNSGSVIGQLHVDGAPVGASLSLPGSLDWDSTAFGNGPHVLTAVARDPSGNEATSNPIDVWLDNGAAGDINPPQVNMGMSACCVVGGTVLISIDGYDEYFPVTGQLYVDGAPFGSPAELPTQLNWDSTGAADGGHTLTAHAWDPNGNEGIGSPVEILVDNTPPGIAITSPADGAEVGPSFQVQASVDDANVGWVTYQLDGVDAGYPTSPYPPWTAYVSTAGLLPGPHVLTATAMDAAGNVGSSAPVDVVLLNDTVAPTVSWSSTLDGRAVRPSATLTAVISSYDVYGVTRIELWADGAFFTGQDGKPPNLTWTAPAAEGAHVLQLRAWDAAGNMGVSSLATVTVDGTKPTGSFAAPLAGATVSDDVVLEIAANDATGVSYVSFYAGSEFLGSDDVAPWGLTWDSGTGANGAETLRAFVVDLAGNSFEVPSLSVDVQNPWLVQWDSGINGWTCMGRNAKCGAPTVFSGRATFGSEGQPSTLGGSCPDGAVAELPYDPKPFVTSIRVETVGGQPLDASKPVRATVVAYGDWSKSDFVDLYYATDATAPAWTWIGTVRFTSAMTSGATLTFDWTLGSANPNGLHAVRATARRGGTAAACTTGDHDDHDDVAFEVGDHQPPTVAITSPAPGATLVGPTPVTLDVADASGIASIALSSDYLGIAELTTAPWSFTLNTLARRNGPQVLRAHATDTIGLYATSEGIPVTIANPVTELLVNGGFDGGHVGWTEVPAGAVLDGGATYTARTGAWKAVLGGKGVASSSSICQTVTIPASAQRVEPSFYLQTQTAEVMPGRDTLLFDVRKADDTWLANLFYFDNQDPSASYRLLWNEVSRFRGQAVKLCFTVTEDAGEATAFLIDDVSMWWK